MDKPAGHVSLLPVAWSPLMLAQESCHAHRQGDQEHCLVLGLCTPWQTPHRRCKINEAAGTEKLERHMPDRQPGITGYFASSRALRLEVSEVFCHPEVFDLTTHLHRCMVCLHCQLFAQGITVTAVLCKYSRRLFLRRCHALSGRRAPALSFGGCARACCGNADCVLNPSGMAL